MTAERTDVVVGAVQAPELHVMSFNVRVDAASPPGHPDHWPDREPLLRGLLRREQPSLLGVQEPLAHQMEAIADALGERYRVVGEGREGGSRGEHSSIFYDTERLELLEHGQSWLSDEPDVVGSVGWGATLPRIVVWARLRDRVTGRSLLHVNSHFDHASEEARDRSAQTVVELIAAHRGDVDGVLFTADANAAAERSDAYRTLVDGAGLRDSWLVADEQLTEAVASFHDYGTPEPGGDRIDWVLVSPEVRVRAAAIDLAGDDDRRPSDHAAAHAVITLG